MGNTLTQLLQLANGTRAAFVGAGGKTSIIHLLAAQNSHLPVLVTTTTKILPLRQNNVTLCNNLQSCLAHTPAPGTVCAGQLNPATGKLEAFAEGELATLCKPYPLVLIEADGSRGLPCKGWAANEPVVPAFTTTTVGVLTLGGLHKPATKGIVLRLPQFLALTGLQKGQPITLAALAAMASSPAGMFKNAKGTLALVINQAETPPQIELANQLVQHIKQQNPGLIGRYIIGSAQQNRWQLARK
ncbi:putative selenium-dependent hydroxylase accessory protein YqeC [Ruminococcaceae bacterium OttesenSCG-928-A16]|nr:putative selenium-dependent hydroxylase accessory protein YqeC [Ruminococcaceae bacterium OttesenSCG-928-A16]